MTVSAYSAVSAVIFFVLMLTVVYLLRRSTDFVMHYTVFTLLFLTGLSLLRLLLPLDLDQAYVINSSKVMPALRDFFERPLVAALPWFKPHVVLLVVWAVGAAFALRKELRSLKLSRQLIRYFRFREVERPQVQELAKRLGIRHPVVVSRGVASPLSAGPIRPTIYLPDGDWTEEQLGYAMRHEDSHLRSGDPALKILYGFFCVLFWWLPIVPRFYDSFIAMLEMRCDVRATKDLSERERLDYLRAALDFLEHSVVAGQKTPTVCSLSDNPDELKQRFSVLARWNERRPWYRRAAVCLLALALFVGSYFVILQPYGMPPELEEPGVYTYYPGVSEDVWIEHRDDEYILHLDALGCTGNLSEEMLNSPPFNEMTIIERNSTP